LITVHHLGVSQSERVVWLFEELQIPYSLKRYVREPSGQAPADYRALSPMGIAPVITDGDLVLGESGAIVEYVTARYGNNRLTIAPEQPAFADYLFWFHFANGTFMPSELSGIMTSMLGLPEGNPILSMLKARSERAFAMTEARLASAAYFAGSEFTLADIMMLFPMTTMRAFARRDLASYPSIRAYLARIGARAAYQRAMAKGDPGMAPLLS
jgi:glutathione S-transferase